jgi:hypothetical protein
MPKPAGEGPLRPIPGYTPGGSASVDGSGRYRLFNLPPGEYAVAVSYGASTRAVGSSGSAEVVAGIGSGTQYYPTNEHPRFFTVAGGEVYGNTDFTVSPAALYTVSGKVEQPSVQGRFWIALSAPDQPSLAVAVTQGAADGSFKLEGIQPGAYRLIASGPSRARSGLGAVLEPDPYFGSARITVGPENVEGVSIAVQKGRPAAFALHSAAERPESFCAPTAKLALTALEDWAAQLDRSGDVSFAKPLTLEGLAPMRYQVAVTGLGPTCYQAAPLTIDLSRGDSGPFTVPVAAAGSIHGKLVGTPAGSDFVVALATAGETSVQLALPDRDGRFQFEALRPGRYYIIGRPVTETPRGRWAPDLKSMVEIEIPGGRTMELELPVQQ